LLCKGIFGQMATSVFSPSPPNEIETKLQTRTYIYGQSSNVLVLDSPYDQTSLVLTNNLRAKDINDTYTNLFALSASNEVFNITRDQVVLARFDKSRDAAGGDVPRLIVPGGHVTADRFTIEAPEVRKAFVVQDFNELGLHQFAGIGYTAGILNYQVPVSSSIHAFYVGYDANSSTELMRIQRVDNNTQVGIGTNAIRSGVSLEVAGGVHISKDLTIEGALHLSGTLDLSQAQGIARLDPLTQKVAPTVLPEKLLYLNTTNQIDASYLPALYSGPYIRGLRNVGIGTRTPIQKLHVIGTTVTSERLGVGTNRPVARLHVYDNTIATPTFRIDKPGSGDAIVVYGPNNAVAFNVTSAGAVGIGMYNNDTTVPLRIAGGLNLDGILSVDRFEWRNRATNTPYMSDTQVTLSDGTVEDALQAHVPFQASKRIVTPEIMYGGSPSSPASAPNVRFRSSGIHVELDAIFERPITTVSDARVKCNIKRVPAPLSALDKIHGYTYNYCKSMAHGASSGGGVQSAGLLAQEVERGFPTAVTHLDDGRLAVQYDSVLALLVEGFHELKRSVKSLESKFERMQK
jgi:hypothetical protein